MAKNTDPYREEDDDEFYQEDVSPIKVGLIIAGIMIGIAVISFLIIHFSGQTEEEEFSSDTLGNEELAEIENTVSGFLSQAGNFGLIEDEYRAEDFHQIYEVYRNEEPASLIGFDELFELRNESYAQVRNEYILPDSYVWFSDEDIDNWEVLDDISMQRNFVINQESIDFIEAEVIEGDENSTRVVDVEVSWTSQEKIRQEVSKAPRAGWDGSVRVLGKNYAENANIVLTETTNGWLVSNIRNLGTNYVLSTWENPTQIESIQGFSEVSTLTPSPPFRILQETTGGEYIDEMGNSVEANEINPGDHLLSSGFYHYCLEDMPEEYGDPSDYGYHQEEFDDGSCRWVLDNDMTPVHPH